MRVFDGGIMVIIDDECEKGKGTMMIMMMMMITII